MKITPLEIRQKTFEKVFRGLDKEEVNAFLISLSQEWEKLVDENKELRIKLESSEKEVGKLREVENSLFKTLKTAEDTGANMIDQATRTAELHMRETQMKSEAMINDAKSKARDMIEEAELRSKHAIDDMEDRIRSLALLHRNLENIRDDLVSDIKSFASDALDKVDRVKSQIKKVDVEDELIKIKRDNMDRSKPQVLDLEMEPSTEMQENSDTEQKKSSNKVSKQEQVDTKSDESRSFFDEIE
ncbi:DivIVA domain-containing protein [Fulvivirga sp. M361]|uniref:DivIVA domain-containing protein n=1 Tax=Fulvivirga sp. M361 TaxID=2594266 RepID=UPI00117A9DEE|nr:DivIVA domain-containing protein [Fulvivirga sp. M361]TRX53797.1 DivIVA domain-containing protein [Fulvivirga sp. M361]